jgi:hypothetical protein
VNTQWPSKRRANTFFPERITLKKMHHKENCLVFVSIIRIAKSRMYTYDRASRNGNVFETTSFLLGLIDQAIHGIAFSKYNCKTIGVKQSTNDSSVFQEEKDKWFSYLKRNNS